MRLLTLFVVLFIAVSSMAQDNSTDEIDKMFCARQMLSLLPILQKLGTAAANDNTYGIVKNGLTLKKKAKSLKTYCGLELPTVNPNKVNVDCLTAANDIYAIAKPLIGHPSSFSDNLKAFQDLLNTLPELQDSCGDAQDALDA